MSIFKKPLSRFWHYSIYRSGKTYLRGSTGTEDRATAEAIESTLRMAQQRNIPADRLHRMIDALTGGQIDNGLPLAGIWTEYEAWISAESASLSANTLRDRKSAVRRFVDWAAKHWPAAERMEAVDRACAAGFAKYLAASGAKTKTRANILSDLGTVWSDLQRVRDGIAANPWRLVIPAIRDSEWIENCLHVASEVDAPQHKW